MSPAVFGHGRLRLYLLKLLDDSPRHGYDVIRELEDRFMGLYSPSAGTVYPRLARLESEGLVTHMVIDGRKVYSITDAGRAELAARQGELDDLEADIAGSVRDLADEIRGEVHGSVRDLKAELKAAARDLRREARSRGRTASAQWYSGPPPPPGPRHRPAPPHPPGQPPPPGAGWGPFTAPSDGDDLGEWFRGQLSELMAHAGRRLPTEQQRAELKQVLVRALADVRRIMSEPQQHDTTEEAR